MSIHDDTSELSEPANTSDNPTFDSLLEERISRRQAIKAGLGSAMIAFASGSAGLLAPSRAEAAGLLGFTPVPTSTTDTVVLPPGYAGEILYAWGDPVSDGPRFAFDASNSAADQRRQCGMHNDGIHFFSLPDYRVDSSDHGLLVMNHEYTDEGLLHVGGANPWTADKTLKSQMSHGVSVIEVELRGGRWRVVRPSRFARRVTARTKIWFDGAAAGHPLLRRSTRVHGSRSLGTARSSSTWATTSASSTSTSSSAGAFFGRTRHAASTWICSPRASSSSPASTRTEPANGFFSPPIAPGSTPRTASARWQR